MADAATRIQEMLRKFQEQAQQASELRSAMQDLRGSASSPDGSVTVTVAPSGAILDLKLTPNAVRRSHTELQQAILGAVRQATADAAQQLDDTVAPILGDRFGQFQQAFNAEAPVLRPDAATGEETAGGAEPTTASSASDDPDDDFSSESFLR